MTRHAAIRANPHEPCPFCGCSMTAAAARRPRAAANARSYITVTGRTITLAGKEAAYQAWRERTPRCDGAGVASWAYPETGTRAFTASERTDLDAVHAGLEAHRGMVAVVDPRTNKITGWTRPKTAATEAAA